MSFEPRLSALRALPPIGFIYRSLTFDMMGVPEPDFKAQLAQVIDLGLAVVTSAALRVEVLALQDDGGPRRIRLYSDQKQMAAGSGTTGEDGSYGLSAWRGPQGVMDHVSPVAQRTDLRIFIDQTGGTGVSIRDQMVCIALPCGRWSGCYGMNSTISPRRKRM